MMLVGVGFPFSGDLPFLFCAEAPHGTGLSKLSVSVQGHTLVQTLPAARWST